MSKRDKSPCVDVCKYAGPRGWCLGCGMTRKESRGWDGLKPYDRTSLRKALTRRVAEMRRETQDEPEPT